MTSRLTALLLVFLVILGACGSAGSSAGAGSPSAPVPASGSGAAPSTASGVPSAGSKLNVVTSTTVFADMVRNVGGDLVNVSSLVPANGDVHTFSPKPSDIRTLSAAQLVFMNGLNLDDWLSKTIDSVASHAPVVKLSVDLPGATYEMGEDPNGPSNPHLWMNVAYAQLYVDRIATALSTADPAHAATYDVQGKAYRSHLGELDAYVKQQIGSIPAANRRFVAFHDAFPYYAKAYGLEIVGVAVEAPGQDPSASYTAELIRAIKAAHVKAIFSEAQFPPKLVQQLAQETGTSVVAELYDDAIGDPPITSYEAIIRWDSDQFVKALS